jgi:hypothetical protein
MMLICEYILCNFIRGKNYVNPFQLISRYFWVICLAFSLINFVTSQYRLKSRTTSDSEKREIGSRYLIWFSLANTIPWVVMGWGQVIGGVPSVWYYFRPQDQNPYVITWFVSIFLLSVIYTIWVFAADGVNKIREYELLSAIGVRSNHLTSEVLIKIFAALGPAFVLLWVYLVSTMNATIPP